MNTFSISEMVWVSVTSVSIVIGADERFEAPVNFIEATTGKSKTPMRKVVLPDMMSVFTTLVDLMLVFINIKRRR